MASCPTVIGVQQKETTTIRWSFLSGSPCWTRTNDTAVNSWAKAVFSLSLVSKKVPFLGLFRFCRSVSFHSARHILCPICAGFVPGKTSSRRRFPLLLRKAVRLCYAVPTGSVLPRVPTLKMFCVVWNQSLAPSGRAAASFVPEGRAGSMRSSCAVFARSVRRLPVCSGAFAQK